MIKKLKSYGWIAAALLLVTSAGRGLYADVNVALGKSALQSTTEFGGDALRAVDGNTSGNYGNNSVTHTATGDPAPSWEVDLGEEFDITRIVLWGRTDCCMWRLTNFRISILDSFGTEVEGEDFFIDLTFPDTTVDGFEWDVPAGTTGQTVRIDSLGLDSMSTQYLSLAEVEVFSDAADIAPAITGQPRGGKAFIGGAFTLEVQATGSDPLSYQWQKDGSDLTGKTSSTLLLDPVAAGDEGSYTVEVSNPAGDANSDPVIVKVFNGRNLALDGEASQSTTGYGGDAPRGNDGNTSGAYGNNSVTHTADGDPTPWWEVLLVGPSTIEAVYIWGRTDCCQGRLANFRVSVLDTDRIEVSSEDFFTDGSFPDTTLEGFEILLSPGTVGQIVRVELLGDLLGAGLYLSLAEVEVLGDGPEPPPDPNLARKGTASQSSTLDVFGADRAINGNLGDFTHTLAGDALPATWQVDLGGMFDIEEIVVWNRMGCCPSRLRDITVSILNSAGDMTIFESELLNPENELGGSIDTAGPERLNLDLVELTGGVVNGGIVRVTRTPDDDLSGSGGIGNADEADVLSLAEVQVFTHVDCPVAGDTHCNPASFNVEGPALGGPGTYTVTAGGSDDSGDAVRFTFTADNGVDPPRVIGPQASPTTVFKLGLGTWTITATADDQARCPDEAADASCSEVVDIPHDPLNKATKGTATQSSTGYGGDASRAIDGNTSGLYEVEFGTLTHTADNDPDPWWEVELEADFTLDRIVLWNRTDCCAERLTNFRVSVLDSGRDEVYSEDFFTDLSFPDTLVDGFEIPLPVGTDGRIVRVELLPEGAAARYLTLAEVQVFCPDGAPTEVFHRGDSDDNGSLQLTDAVRVLGFLFLGAAEPGCLDAADADDNGSLQLTDAVRILGFLFLGGDAPSPPGPPPGACGPDPTEDELNCATYNSCP